jgi:conflict system pore-forming effector with SLATT domain
MFSLTVIDHVRLDCEHVARNYTMHARAADRFASLSFGVRIVMAALLAAAAAACVSSALLPARFYQLAAVGATTAAMIGFALYSVLGLEARVSAHRSFAHRLWIVTERYRSLLAEANDGIVDVNAILRRRDELIEQVHAIYERGFAVDQPAYEAVRLPIYETPSSNAA